MGPSYCDDCSQEIRRTEEALWAAIASLLDLSWLKDRAITLGFVMHRKRIVTPI